MWEAEDHEDFPATVPAPDPLTPGRFLPNGQAAKRGLNRALRGAALARVQDMLSYKASLAGVALIEVDPANTSRRCHACGHTAVENRKSQAVFCCTECGHTDNADTNAARNIWQKGHARLPDTVRSSTPSRGGTHPGVEEYQSEGTGSRLVLPQPR